MERVTLKKYARDHKMSFFNVVKMVKSGDLPSETVEEEGKEVTYVLVDQGGKEKKVQTCDPSETDATGVEERMAKLENEMALLRRELDALKISMGLKG